jgi:DNA-binding NarL/FixJ family response regulator
VQAQEIQVTAKSAEGRPAIRVMLVDDHRTFAELLAATLGREPDLTCVGIAESTAAALDIARREQPDLVVMDIKLGPENGLEAARRIRDVLPDAVIVVVSAHREAEWVVRAAQAGASAFAAKTGSLDEMLSILRQASLGSMLVSPSTFQEMPRTERPPAGVEPLSAREQEVLNLMGQALPPQEIAPLLNISVNTCRGYVKSIHAKLQVRSQLEAVVKAQRLGLIEISPDA